MLAGALNGIGSQRAAAAVSLLGGGVQQLCTLVLTPVPGVGMGGYVAGALVSAAVELVLCLYWTARRTGLRVRLFQWITAPGLAALLAALSGNLLFRMLKDGGLGPLPAALATLAFAGLLYLAALQAQGVSVRKTLRLGAFRPGRREKTGTAP